MAASCRATARMLGATSAEGGIACACAGGASAASACGAAGCATAASETSAAATLAGSEASSGRCASTGSVRGRPATPTEAASTKGSAGLLSAGLTGEWSAWAAPAAGVAAASSSSPPPRGATAGERGSGVGASVASDASGAGGRSIACRAVLGPATTGWVGEPGPPFGRSLAPAEETEAVAAGVAVTDSGATEADADADGLSAAAVAKRPPSACGRRRAARLSTDLA
mmetsp:Transcript_10071/g.39218  ORF Transcript_10071/g.39218 Transcript_10071/m.39218 type:complete len:227 (-) Transcript_10071:1026-1706(-)